MRLYEFVEILMEGARTPHPEDSIFKGSDAATQTITAMLNSAKTPQNITIKWDGSPAIVFGRRASDGKFTMNYKEYIGTEGGQVTSARELVNYFASHGKNMAVAEKLARVFPAVASTVPPGFQGFVQGDVMWADADQDVQLQDGHYMFKPNPHGVQYRVAVDSPVGKQIQGRPVGIAVHTRGTGVTANKDTPLMDRSTMQGLDGLLGTNKYITVFTGSMNHQFAVETPPQAQVSHAQAAVAKFRESGGDQLLAALTQATKDRLQQYYNRKVTKQAVDAQWLESHITKPQLAVITAPQNKPAVQALDQVYTAITALKMNILAQLEPQVQGIEQFVGRVPKGEGFNLDTPQGFMKLVNRGVFSAANFAGRA
jgi:hypothetical protein